MSANFAAIIARRRPSFGGAGIDTRQEAGHVASHYLFYRRRRGMGAVAAMRAARELPAAYVAGHGYYGDSAPYGPEYRHGGDTLRHVADWRAAGLRFVGYADDIADLSHTGWLTDDYGGKLRAAVWQLPARDGESILVPGYQEWEGRGEMNEGSAVLVMSDVTRCPMRGQYDGLEAADEARDAARLADGTAESVADDERDYNAAYERGRIAGEADGEAIEARGELLPLLAELRGLRRSAVAGTVPAVCHAIRARVDSLLETISEKREARDASWRDTPSYDEDAWKTGFMDSEGGSFVRAVRLGYAKATDWQGSPESNPCHA